MTSLCLFAAFLLAAPQVERPRARPACAPATQPTATLTATRAHLWLDGAVDPNLEHLEGHLALVAPRDRPMSELRPLLVALAQSDAEVSISALDPSGKPHLVKLNLVKLERGTYRSYTDGPRIDGDQLKPPDGPLGAKGHLDVTDATTWGQFTAIYATVCPVSVLPRAMKRYLPGSGIARIARDRPSKPRPERPLPADIDERLQRLSRPFGGCYAQYRPEIELPVKVPVRLEIAPSGFPKRIETRPPHGDEALQTCLRFKIRRRFRLPQSKKGTTVDAFVEARGEE